MAQAKASRLLAEVRLAELKQAINQVCKAIPKRPTFNIFGFILFSTKNGVLSLKNFNPGHLIEVKIDCTPTIPAAIAIEAASIKKWITKLPRSSSLGIEITPDTKTIKFFDSKRDITFPGITSESYPETPAPTNLTAKIILDWRKLD